MLIHTDCTFDFAPLSQVFCQKMYSIAFIVIFRYELPHGFLGLPFSQFRFYPYMNFWSHRSVAA